MGRTVATERKPKGVAVRRAGQLLGGKAAGTVRELVWLGELDDFEVETESGHFRQYITYDSIHRFNRRNRKAA